MNDLERLAAADGAEGENRAKVIAYLADRTAESLLEDLKEAYWYIRNQAEGDFETWPWHLLVEELQERWAGDEDHFTLADLDDVP